MPKVKPESCVFLIKSSKTLINGSLPYEKVLKMIDVYIKMTKNNNFKVVAASFDGLRNDLNLANDGLIILKCTRPKQFDAPDLQSQYHRATTPSK